MEALEAHMSAISKALIQLFWGSGFMVYILLGAGLYFTARTLFVQIRYFPLMFKLLGEDAHNKKGVSSFQAFALSVAGRVGVGNIVGVALAVLKGGPGAVFWMWVMAFISMATAFVESLLAQLYKVKEGDDYFRGGPSYYLSRGLNSRFLSVTFALSMILTFGYVVNMQQANVVGSLAVTTFNVQPVVASTFLSLLLLLVVVGGMKRIVGVVTALVPTMAFVYVGLSLVIMIMHITEIPAMFGLIFENAFSGKAAVGGLLGTVVSMGVRRGLLSNEAGVGSAPAAAAVVSTSHPVKQALVQSLSVFTDTIIICSATAFVFILSGFYNSDPALDGGLLMSQAWVSNFGTVGYYILVLAIFVFAITTMISSYYYGESSLMFLLKKDKVPLLFKLTVGFMVFLGPLVTGELVWDLIDIFIAVTALINIYGLLRLFPQVKLVLKDFETQFKAGLNPVFKRSSVAGLNVDCWDDDGTND